MEACLQQYIPGCIIDYTAPFTKPVCQKLGIPSTRPLLIVGTSPAHPTSDVQAMMITTSENYYGFRIYMNTLNPKLRKECIICPTKIYTIERKYLGGILGFITPALLKKCREAYAYEIGLTDTPPEYYLNDEICRQYMYAGNPNQPVNPEPFRTHFDPTPNTYLKTGVAFDSKLIEDKGRDGSRKCAKTYVELVDPTPISSPEPNTYEVDKSGSEEEVTNETKDTTTDQPVNAHEPVELDFPFDSEGNPIPSTKEGTNDPPISYGCAVSMADIRLRSSSGKLTEALKKAIEGHQFESFTVTAQIKELTAKLTPEQRYDIFTYRLGASAIAKLLNCTPYFAKKVITLSNNEIIRDKDRLVEGVLDGSINLKYIPNGMILAFSLMSLSEVRDIKMGIATYHSYAKLFSLQRTFISELQLEGLL